MLLLAVHIPDCDGTEDAEIVASEFVEIINEERDRNWDMSAPLHLPRPDGRVTVCLLPNPAFVTPGQIIDHFALVAERDRLRKAVERVANATPTMTDLRDAQLAARAVLLPQKGVGEPRCNCDTAPVGVGCPVHPEGSAAGEDPQEDAD